MTELMRITAIALTGGVAALTLRKYNSGFAVLTAAAVGICVMALCVDMAAEAVDGLRALVEQSGLDKEYITVVLKVTGTAYITEFGSELLRDCGEGAIAAKVDLAGKLVILCMIMPVLTDFLRACIGAASGL